LARIELPNLAERSLTSTQPCLRLHDSSARSSSLFLKQSVPVSPFFSVGALLTLRTTFASEICQISDTLASRIHIVLSNYMQTQRGQMLSREVASIQNGTRRSDSSSLKTSRTSLRALLVQIVRMGPHLPHRPQRIRIRNARSKAARP